MGNHATDHANRNRKKLMVAGFQDLLELGGFVGDVALKEMMEVYSDWTTDTIMGAGDFQPSDFAYADELERVLFNRHSYIFDTSRVAWREPYADDDYSADDFAEWFLGKVYRYEKERRTSGEASFWKSFQLAQRDRRALMELSAFEEHLLYLMQGIDRGEARSIDEVGVLDCFAGEGDYVGRCCRMIEKVLESGKLDMKNFFEQCAELGSDNGKEN